MQKYLFIALGGALGSIARFWVGANVTGRMGTRFPYGTLLVNLSACFLIGLSFELLGRHAEVSPAWRYLIAFGLIGAYSTFSTFEWEIFTNLRAGAFWIGILYITVSLVFGLVAVALGSALARTVS